MWRNAGHFTTTDVCPFYRQSQFRRVSCLEVKKAEKMNILVFENENQAAQNLYDGMFAIIWLPWHWVSCNWRRVILNYKIRRKFVVLKIVSTFRKRTTFAGSSLLILKICCFSLDLMIVNEAPLSFGLLVWKQNHSEDVKLGSREFCLCFLIPDFFFLHVLH